MVLMERYQNRHDFSQAQALSAATGFVTSSRM
jgi:hypothetical protein